MIIRKEAYFKSDNGVNQIRSLIWTDDEIKQVGVVQIAHGLAEHIGRYDDFARYLTSLGFVVCGNDHIGHGKSVECLSDLGLCYDGGHITMLRDMNTLHRIMARRYPGLPYVIFGHSMGSLLARVYAASFGDSLAGAVFCGTAQLPKPVLLLEDPVDYLLSKLPENQNTSDAMGSLFGKFTMKLLSEKDPLAWLSKSEKNRQTYKEDPLCGFNMGNSLAKEIAYLAVRVSTPGWAEKLPVGFPVMLVSGAKDPVGAFGRGVLSAANELNAAGIEPEVILYPGFRHEILNEDENEKVYHDIASFLQKIIIGSER